MKNIVIRGAREHNLKNIDLELPRDSLVVVSGLSGSGKSSLAFDTIFAEGQRRYVESLSSYARQFLGRLDKPDLDYIEGLSPAIAIEQKTTHRNPRSTVGTVTEIYDYLRLLFARIGIAALPALRPRDPGAVGGPDRRLAPGPARRDEGRAPGACGRSEEGGAPEDPRGREADGVRARAGRRGDTGTRRGDHPRPQAQAHHRDRRGPAGRVSREPPKIRGVRRRGAGDLRRHSDRPRAREVGRAGDPLLPEERLSELRDQHPGAAAAALLLQQPFRCVRKMLRPRGDPRVRSRTGRARPGPVVQRRGHRPVQPEGKLAPKPVRISGEALQVLSWTPLSKTFQPASSTFC